MDDLLDFLFLTFGIERTELVQDAEDIFDVSFRGRFTELLRERKGRWTRPGEEGELDVRVRHDVEMYLGVLARRRAEPLRESGYDNWWVTTDGTAHTMRRIGAADGLRLPSSPCMHPDFLTNLLALGPQRRELQAKQLALLPVALHIQNVGWGVPALSEIADQIRRDSAGQPEYVIRRKLRDALDSLRVGRGREDHDFELDSALT